ncbi:hypothetical protein [Arthrobacter sp. MDT1-65]
MTDGREDDVFAPPVTITTTGRLFREQPALPFVVRGDDPAPRPDTVVARTQRG